MELGADQNEDDPHQRSRPVFNARRFRHFSGKKHKESKGPLLPCALPSLKLNVGYTGTGYIRFPRSVVLNISFSSREEVCSSRPCLK